MVLLTILVLPLPSSIRKVFFNTYQMLYNKREIKTIIYISATLISLLFADSLNNTWKYKTNGTMDPRNYKGSSYSYGAEYSARIFYNQRNLYIAGANLFLIVAIPTVFSIIRRLIKYEDMNVEKKTQEEMSFTLEELKIENEKLEVNLVALKKQKSGLERAYDDRVDNLNNVTVADGNVTTDKKDSKEN